MRKARSTGKAAEKPGVWVELEINKGVVDGVLFTWPYRGLLAEDQHRMLMESPDSRAFLRLDHVYWIDAKKQKAADLDIYPVRFGKDYLFRNFHGPFFFRACDVVSLCHIDGKKDLAWINDAARWKHPEELFMEHEFGRITASRPGNAVNGRKTEKTWMEIVFCSRHHSAGSTHSSTVSRSCEARAGP